VLEFENDDIAAEIQNGVDLAALIGDIGPKETRELGVIVVFSPLIEKNVQSSQTIVG